MRGKCLLGGGNKVALPTKQLDFPPFCDYSGQINFGSIAAGLTGKSINYYLYFIVRGKDLFLKKSFFSVDAFMKKAYGIL